MEVLFTDEELKSLYVSSEKLFRSYLAECARYGLTPKEEIKLKRHDGILAFYDLQTKDFYFSLPEVADEMGDLRLQFLKSVMGFKENPELAEFIRLSVPYSMAHELGHYFRDQAGLMTKDLWLEEQIANKLANALSLRRYSPAERLKLVTMLKTVKAHLKTQIQRSDADSASIEATCHDPLSAFAVLGALKADTIRQAHVMERFLKIDAMEALQGSGALSEDLIARLGNRKNIIDAFNNEQIAGLADFLSYNFSWQLINFESSERFYVEGFAREYMNIIPHLLSPPQNTSATENNLRALFAASSFIRASSPTAARYFYKRYRAMFLVWLSDLDTTQDLNLGADLTNMLEIWEEGEPDPLDMISKVLPEHLRKLLPARMDVTQVGEGDVPSLLSDATDQKIWRHLKGIENDAAAERLLERLAWLDRIEIFRPLPAAVLVELSTSLLDAYYNEGDTIIWQGEANDDVFILASGALSVSVGLGADERVVAKISEGEIFGEISFITRKARTATVRATTPAACFVLPAPDLTVLSFRHPIVLMHIAKVLAKRLAEVKRG